MKSNNKKYKSTVNHFIIQQHKKRRVIKTY